MSAERIVRIVAGIFIMLSVLMFSFTHSDSGILSKPNWLWFTLFVGANLLQSGFTKWCLMDSILNKCGKESCIR